MVYGIVDHQRGPQLWVLAAAFALVVVAFGRWCGVTAIAGLGATFALLLFFVVPAILAGEPPLLVAIVGSAAIVLTVLNLTHRPTLSTTVAVLGTLASLTQTGLLSAAAVAALHLTGITNDLSSSVGVHCVTWRGCCSRGSSSDRSVCTTTSPSARKQRHRARPRETGVRLRTALPPAAASIGPTSPR